MDSPKNISFGEILVLILLYSVFGGGNNTSYVKAKYVIENPHDNDSSIQAINKYHKNKHLFTDNFNIHNVRKKLKYVDNYFSHVQNIKNKTLKIKKEGKQGTNKFLMESLKHSLGSDFNKIESMVNMLPLLNSMGELKDVFLPENIDKNDDAKIKEVKNNDIKEEKELNNNKDFEDILELVNLLS